MQPEVSDRGLGAMLSQVVGQHGTHPPPPPQRIFRALVCEWRVESELVYQFHHIETILFSELMKNIETLRNVVL